MGLLTLLLYCSYSWPLMSGVFPRPLGRCFDGLSTGLLFSDSLSAFLLSQVACGTKDSPVLDSQRTARDHRPLRWKRVHGSLKDKDFCLPLVGRGSPWHQSSSAQRRESRLAHPSRITSHAMGRRVDASLASFYPFGTPRTLPWATRSPGSLCTLWLWSTCF